MKRLEIIDGHAILYRAYHALPLLTTAKGQPIGAVYGFVSMLLKTIQDLKPTHLVVTFDRKEETFRKKLFKDYQVQRPAMNEDLVSQVDLIHKILKDMGVSVYEVPGFEADDVIGTLSKTATENHEFEVIIVTGDKDILQLVDDLTRVYMPVKGISEMKIFGRDEVVERLGVEPKKVTELKGLMGDSSDNYPGVSGIGPKTAVTLIEKFSTIDGIYNNLDKIEGKLKEKLASGRESAFLSKQLATIVRNVPVELDEATSKLGNFDRPDIRSLFEELEFRSLITRLSGNNNSQNPKSKVQKKSKIQITKNAEQTSMF